MPTVKDIFASIFTNIVGEAILSDPKMVYQIIDDIVTPYLQNINVNQFIDVLDRNLTPEQVYGKVPPELVNRVRGLFSHLSPADKNRIMTYAVNYLTLPNVLQWLKQKNNDAFTVVINHPNGVNFIRNFIKFILRNLKEILGV